jgi:rod shape determining protein RodA
MHPLPLTAPPSTYSLGLKLRRLNWGLVVLVVFIALIGIGLQYSAGGGNWQPFASRQALRFLVGFCLMLIIALFDIRFYLRWAYWIYGLTLALLIAVEVIGQIGMGAQRWINFGFFVLQPSELMKISLALALARYFHGLTYEQVGKPLLLIIPLGLIALPVILVLLQPNLGTATLLAATSGAVFLMAGVRIWKFAIVIGGIAAALPIGWNFLHDYQKNRIYTFLDPERDPLGTGYNIMQSKIAFGAGGLFGKGWGQGTQSQLRFLPEKETDFIFTVLGEEFGLMGCLLVLLLFLMVFIYGYVIAISSRNQFGRLLAGSLVTTLFLYVFINVAMVSGLIPVVGIPMPLVSYGGTATLTLSIAIGLLLSIAIHREVHIDRHFSHESL